MQSQLCVLIGAVCTAAGCLIEANPALGLTGTSAFVVLSAFTALFHDGRLMSATWLVGATTLVAIAVRLGAFEPGITAAGILLFALINAFVVFVCRTMIRLINADVHYAELEPLTGLLTRDAFSDRVATMIAARDRNDDRFLAIAVVSLDSFSLLTAMSGETGGNEARVAIGHRLAETLRRDAVLAHVGESEYLVADSFTSDCAERADGPTAAHRPHGALPADGEHRRGRHAAGRPRRSSAARRRRGTHHDRHLERLHRPQGRWPTHRVDGEPATDLPRRPRLPADWDNDGLTA